MSEQVFVLTSDSIAEWECDIIRFPTPIVVKSQGTNARSETAYTQAFEDLRAEAKKLGANVVLAVRFSDPEYFAGVRQWKVRAIGTPAYVNPPLPDPEEYMELLRKGNND